MSVWLSLFTYHGYDSRGNQTNLIDPKQNTTIMIFDGAGRQLQTLQNLRTGGSGANAITSTIVTQQGFDANSNQVRLVDNNGGTTVWAFDSHDRQISETYQDGSRPTYLYNTASDVVTYTDANGSVFVNAWDPMGRKTTTTITPASGIGGTTSQSFQYDGLGRLTLSVDPNINLPAATATAQVVYDSLGRTVEEGQTFAGNVRYLTNSAFTSLPASELTYPNSRQVNTGHDALYRKNSLVEQSTSASIADWQFFGPNRVATVALGNGLLCSNMNNAQNRSAIQSGQTTPPWGSISTDQLGYDGAARMIGKRYFNGSNVIVGFTSAYDESSNKFFERPLHAESRSGLYDSYDSMNRLLDDQRGVLASGGGSITTPITLPDTETDRNWNLDGLGNWASTGFTPVGSSQALTDQRNHNKLNEIIQRTVTGAAPVTFQYDGVSGASNGNLTSDGSLIYLYDALNRLIQVSKVIVTSPMADFGGVGGGAVGSVPVAGGVASSVTSQVVASYFYDALNRRIRKVVVNGGFSEDIPNGTTDYLWQGWQCMEERNPFGGTGSTDTPQRQYVWGQYIDECVQLTTLAVLGPQSLPAGEYYLCQDLLYRAVALTNSTGGIVEAYDTDAYGNTLIFTAPGTDGIWFTDDDVQSSYGANEIIYCGYRFDPESQLYYVRNRMFNPPLGRWIQRDPIGYSGGVNFYEYVGGRAAGLSDPRGLRAGGIAGCLAAAWNRFRSNAERASYVAGMDMATKARDFYNLQFLNLWMTGARLSAVGAATAGVGAVLSAPAEIAGEAAAAATDANIAILQQTSLDYLAGNASAAEVAAAQAAVAGSAQAQTAVQLAGGAYVALGTLA